MDKDLVKNAGQTRKFIASVINIGSDEIVNDIYMSIRLRALTTNPNKNGCAVTEAFIDDVIAHQETMRCLPLVADVRKIEQGDLGGLGHMLDSKGVFHSTQIGSFYSFEKEVNESTVSLIGTARVPKRNKKIIEAITKLFSDGKLNFSFEILVSESQMKNGIEIIDAAPGNTMIGVAIVSDPAEVQAKALALVASENDAGAIDAAFKNAKYIQLAEASIDTLRLWVWQAAHVWFGYEEEQCVERLCPDCAILYMFKTGQTFKMEFIVKEDGLIVTDVYEVTYARKKEGADELDKEKNEQAAEKKVDVTEETKVEQAEKTAVEPEVSKAETETAQQETQEEEEKPAEEEQKDESVADTETASTQEEVEVDTLRQRIESLEKDLEMKEKLIASYELDANRKKAMKVAQRGGLDMDAEDVKEAIENGNLVRIAELVASLEEEDVQEPEQEQKTNPFTAEIKLEKRDHSYMFEPAGK